MRGQREARSREAQTAKPRCAYAGGSSGNGLGEGYTGEVGRAAVLGQTAQGGRQVLRFHGGGVAESGDSGRTVEVGQIVSVAAIDAGVGEKVSSLGSSVPDSRTRPRGDHAIAEAAPTGGNGVGTW